MRRDTKRWCLGVMLAGLMTPQVAAAQIVWDTPSMMRPGAPSGLSILLLEAHPSDELGAMVGWRSAAAPAGLGFRVGLGEEADGDLAAMFGLDVSGGLGALDPEIGRPEVLWWSGVGLGVGDEVLASVPLGIVLGWRGAGDGLTFMPYLGGHMALDVMSGPGDDLDIDGAVDLGMDLGFRSGLMFRLGVGIGGRDALAVGVRLPT